MTQPTIIYYPTIPCPLCDGGNKEPMRTKPLFADGPDFNGIVDVCAQCGGKKTIISPDCEVSPEERLRKAQAFRQAMITLQMSMLDLAKFWGMPATVISDLRSGKAYLKEPEIDTEMALYIARPEGIFRGSSC